MKATGNNIIIRQDPPVERTEAGILIPVEAREPRNTGTVVAGEIPAKDEVEEGGTNFSIIQPGDRVCFNHRRGYEVEDGGETFLSINKNFILSKL